jgi:hypothetical protein
MSAVTAIISLRKRRSTPRRLFNKSGPVSRTLFSDIPFRMRVHVFGNSPSPPIATLGLRKVAQKAESKYGSHITQFVGKDFYVDDGLSKL